jgi:hypothetical protein
VFHGRPNAIARTQQVNPVASKNSNEGMFPRPSNARAAFRVATHIRLVSLYRSEGRGAASAASLQETHVLQGRILATQLVNLADTLLELAEG